MAKRPITQTRRTAVTPLTKGANPSPATLNRNKFPFRTPAPKSSHSSQSEENLYTPSSDVASSTRREHRGEAVQRAQARMRGVAPADLDDAGEGPIGLSIDDDDDTDGAIEQVEDSTRAADAIKLLQPADEDGRLLYDFMQSLGEHAREKIQRMIDSSRGATAAAPSTPTRSKHDLDSADLQRQTRQLIEQAEQYVPPPVKRSVGAELVGRSPIAEDIDRLWDWLRQDPPASNPFLGRMPKTSQQLYRDLATLWDAEANGTGLLRALYIEEGDLPSSHIGFLLLAPILTMDAIAVVHLYLQPQLRMRYLQFLPRVAALASALLPQFKLAILPLAGKVSDYHAALAPQGFAAHTIFMR